ncbi:hypothetical protein DL95DRAFT_30880 [Leptodontidium sp. 2 PMI_412]|nr:hypothetical protein DL95DRAFT_30880 [Leptodontidium sp. 2 PMI_412]
MSLQSSIWPQEIPSGKMALVLKMFSILDDSSENSSQRLADEIFANDGQIKNGKQSFSGKAEISACRQNAWASWSARKHSVLRVYSRSEDSAKTMDDILFLGSLAATFPNGESATGGFCARIVFASLESAEETKIKSYEVWADSTPFLTAMNKKT